MSCLIKVYLKDNHNIFRKMTITKFNETEILKEKKAHIDSKP